MKIKEIKNLDGEIIFNYDEDDERWIWGKYDLTGANLEKANLQGVIWLDVILRKANLRNADFYWGSLFTSDLSEADCEGTRFSGTNLEDVNFTRANLRKTIFGRDNLGGHTDLRGANFSETSIEEAIFEHDGAIYNGDTIFPANFDAEKSNLIRFVSKFIIPKFT